MPAYRDYILRQTARTRQRPAWSFLERWLPMVDIARQPVFLPWRSIGLVALLFAITLALLAALIVGSQRRVPAPFGLARAGLVAYATDGDIYTVDPAFGISTAVTTGPEADRDPQWSRDGTRFAFLRAAEDSSGRSRLYIARADGTDLRVVTAEPLAITGVYGFSPNGAQVLLAMSDLGRTQIVVAQTDGSGWRTVDVGVPNVAAGDAGPSWRPPDGEEILFARSDVSVHAVNIQTGVVRTIVEPSAGHYLGTPEWSPDGSRLAYNAWVDASDMTAQIHLVDADGTGDRLLPIPPGAVWQAFRSWSNDGTRLLATRGYTGSYKEAVAVVIPVDGSGTGIEIDYSHVIPPVCCPALEWAPDDASILGIAPDAQGSPLAQVLLDPVAGTASAVPWTTSSLPTWQRLAP
jgi:Tol biopolymer transport system component